MTGVLVIGVGNELRHDDAAGLEVVRRARAISEPEPAIAFREYEGETLGLLGAWEGAAALVIADAVHGGGAVGSIHRFDASSLPLPERLEGSSSTHAVGVGEAIELGRELGRLPGRVVVYGVTGGRFDAGMGLTPELREVLDPLARQVLEEARDLATGAG